MQAEEMTADHRHRAQDLSNQSCSPLKMATWKMANY